MTIEAVRGAFRAQRDQLAVKRLLIGCNRIVQLMPLKKRGVLVTLGANSIVSIGKRDLCKRDDTCS